MSLRIFLIISVFAVLMAGCSSTPVEDIQVDVQVDPKANFAGYETYEWLLEAAILHDSHGQWEPLGFDADAEIKHLIDRELRKHGKAQSSTDPDMVVAFAAGIDMDALELKVDPETKIGDFMNVPAGALVVALVDSETGFVIWRGVATAEVLKDIDAEIIKARLDYAVTKMFKELPK